MKRCRLLFPICGLCGVLVSSAFGDQERVQNDGSNLAIIDIDEIFSKSSAGQGINEQIECINNSEKSDLIELEEKIKQREKTNRSPNEEEARKIEEMQVALYDMTRKRRYRIQKAYQDAMKKLERCVQDCISQVVERENIKIVLPIGAVIYHSNDVINITYDVLQLVNETMATVKVELKDSTE